VLEPDDLPELAVEVEDHAVLEVVRRCHVAGFSLLVELSMHTWSSWTSGRVYPGGP